MVRGFTTGVMEKFTMENGKVGQRKAMEYGEESRESAISENGKIVRHRGMGFICGRMETNMKESGMKA